MAKAGITLGFTAYERRDPVTGTKKQFLRSSRSRQSSPKLKAFQNCVAQNMRGKHATGASAQERAASIRNQFQSVAKGCAK